MHPGIARAVIATGASTAGSEEAVSSRAKSACRISCGSRGRRQEGNQKASDSEEGGTGRSAPEPHRARLRREREKQALDEERSLRADRRGQPCLTAMIVAFSRKAMGWAMSDRIIEKIAVDAFEQAVGRESPSGDDNLAFHDDQGCQYTSRVFQRCLESRGIAQFMSRPGNPWDNALAESFFKTLKRELVNGKGCKTREEAKQDVFKCIGLYCNRRRMHSSIGNAPCDLERDIA